MSNKDLLKEIQRLVGTDVDGLIGPKTFKAICSKIGVEYIGDEKQCWKRIQSKIGVTADGIFGPNTGKRLIEVLGGKVQTQNASYQVQKGDHVIIDIGHAAGTGSRGNGLEEHEVNVIIAGHFKKFLEEYGCKVTVLDFPEKSNASDLSLTAQHANSIGDAKILVSLHSDCAESSSAKGGHVCYRSDSSKVWAKKVAKHLAELLPGRAETVVYRPNLAILKVKSCPSILCEGGFISNAHDADIQKNHPEQIAQAYFRGLTDAY